MAISGEDDDQTGLRRLRGESRDDSGSVVAYLNEQGQPKSWTGDEDAPYVKVISDPLNATDVTLTPGNSGTPGTGNALNWANSGAAAVADLGILLFPGRLYQVYFYNNAGATRYLHIFNRITAPALASVPVIPGLPVAAGQYASLDFGVYGMPFPVGIWLGCSSTVLTYTAAADGVFTAFYLVEVT